MCSLGYRTDSKPFYSYNLATDGHIMTAQTFGQTQSGSGDERGREGEAGISEEEDV